MKAPSFRVRAVIADKELLQRTMVEYAYDVAKGKRKVNDACADLRALAIGMATFTVEIERWVEIDD